VALAIVDGIVRVAGVNVFAEEEDSTNAISIVEVTVLESAFAEQRLDLVVKWVAPLGITVETLPVEIRLIRQILGKEQSGGL
jgi:hypothetical protein